ncbi:hypothetical protein ASF53_22295 [Methylobacterium sp. Leaf123]|uniref:ribbon-helix-helix domain-containing protein n=1 Tax=Methylobacterium sp. Leaf123 TaxID=1736264 RepID=UPI0006FA845F|nr:type II toxin-antitoxin system ParD family antitoxin [Methylobacterium sp. Leaf123]KQQ25411.1 hypothetical protein ASF53_22295 [Methylobacterium sp. Leaf123]
MSKPVILDPLHSAFVDGLVAAGRFPSPDAAVVEGIRLLKAREERLGELREAWRDGAESGGYEPVEIVLDELAADYSARAKAGT